MNSTDTGSHVQLLWAAFSAQCRRSKLSPHCGLEWAHVYQALSTTETLAVKRTVYHTTHKI